MGVRPLGGKKPLKGFFSQYLNFQYEPSNSPTVEFDRLCKTYSWKRDDPERIAAREAFHLATTKQFDYLYGSDEKDINNWRKLCSVLKINPVPDTLHECRAVSCQFSELPCPTSSFVQLVLNKHVNLVDLVHGPLFHGSKVEVRNFKTEKALSEYTKETKKFFPKESARDGGVLRALRRHILVPQEGISSPMRNKGSKRK
jgi:hypothetical protein